MIKNLRRRTLEYLVLPVDSNSVKSFPQQPLMLINLFKPTQNPLPVFLGFFNFFLGLADYQF